MMKEHAAFITLLCITVGTLIFSIILAFGGFTVGETPIRGTEVANATPLAQFIAVFLFFLLSIIVSIPWARTFIPRAGFFEQFVATLTLGAFFIPLSYTLVIVAAILLNIGMNIDTNSIFRAYHDAAAGNMLDAHALISLSGAFIVGVLAWIAREIFAPTHLNT